jgi:methyl-accepting chemotaxis protein
MTRIEQKHTELVAVIAGIWRRSRRHVAFTGLIRALVRPLAVATLILLVDSLLLLPMWLRATGVLLILVSLGAGAALWFIRPLSRRFDAVSVAAQIESKFPDLGERLESATELWDKRGAGRHGYSTALIDALVMETASEIAGVDLSSAARGSGRRRAARTLGLTVLASAVILVALGSRVGPAAERLLHPFARVERISVGIAVEPGDTELVAGESLIVTAVITGPAEAPATLVFQFKGEAVLEREMREAGETVVGRGTMEQEETDEAVRQESPGRRYEASLIDVRTPLTYSITAGDLQSPWFRVNVLERPFVSNIRLDYAFPAYSGLVPRTVDENNGDIAALRGSEVTVTIAAGKPLESAALVMRSGRRIELSRRGPSSFTGVIAVRGGDTYSIELLDTDGLFNVNPPVYSIVAVRDEYPLAKIVDPGEDRELPRDMMLPLAVSAIDDYGISKLRLHYALQERAEEHTVSLAEFGTRGARELVHDSVWDLSETGIMPGSVLVYFVEVVDNDLIGGPKSARTKSYLVRFPSMAEIYREVTDEQDDILDELDDLVEEQKELKDEFEELREDVLSDPEISWQDEAKVEQALESQEEAAERVSEMASRMADLSDRMSETDRVTLDALEKMDEISKLMAEVATDEMRELLQEIRDAMREIRPEQVAEAMSEMTFTQEDYLKRLEQTLNLLKRVKAEQGLQDVANRAERLAEQEQRVADKSAESPGQEQCENMADRQERLREDAERLREDVERAIRDMEDVDRETADAMREAASEFDNAETLEKMQEAARKLAALKPQEASSQCQSAASDLKALFTNLSSCQGGMSCSIQRRDRETVLRAIGELLGVSQEQEEILSAIEDRERLPRSEVIELVAKQTDLAESVSFVAERMFRVSKDSFQIDAGLYRIFGIIEMVMAGSSAALADGPMSAARKEARNALGRVNFLIVKLLTANQSSSSSGSSGALEQLMQQLQQMADRQQEMNQMMEELSRRTEEQGGGSTFEDELAELRAQQERMLEEARRLAEEFGERSEILGRLDDTVKEMEKTVAEMERSGVSQATIDRQKRILSRLLDSQRSLRRRDYKRERRSRSGESYTRTAPGGLPDDVTRASRELREDLLRAMQHEYPAEYRELIRAYFENLTQDAVGEVNP